MKTITFLIDIENGSVRTVGATHSVKGNVDGNINFHEAGIYGLTDKEEIEEVLTEMNEEEYDEIIVKFVESVYLIDGNNNNKVVRDFDSYEEAMAYVDRKKNVENWENAWDTFEQFKEQFFIVTSEQMKKAIHKHGSRMLKYWT